MPDLFVYCKINETLHYHISSYSGNGDLLSCRLHILANCIATDCFCSALLICILQHIAKVVGMQAMQIMQVAHNG